MHARCVHARCVHARYVIGVVVCTPRCMCRCGSRVQAEHEHEALRAWRLSALGIKLFNGLSYFLVFFVWQVARV